MVTLRRNTEDRTLERNYQQKWKFLIAEYLLIKAKKHVRYRFVEDFYKHQGINRQTFCKYYARYRASGNEQDLFPQKRGPRWKARRTSHEVELAVFNERQKGLNRHEICAVLRPLLKNKTPSPSGVYKILKRHNLNRLMPKMKEEKRRIIKERAGELGHLDCHYLSRDLIVSEKKRYFLVCLIDSYSRLAWAEVVEDVKSLTVMFAALKAINWLTVEHKIRFEEILTDNGSEFNGQKSKLTHPFERMLMELGIKHRYTKPYRPQTNGKVERFWRTLNEDLIEGTTFDTLEEFRKELNEYLLYYNHLRPHQALDGLSPVKFMEKNCQRIT